MELRRNDEPVADAADGLDADVGEAEALELGALGGALGACLAWLIFDGHVMSTSGAGATQLAVPLVVGPRIIVLGVLWACVIGMIGACLPAIHAARTPLVAALRGS